MIESGGTLIALLLILALGLVVPEFFKKFRLPFISVLILLGSVFGPYGLNYIPQDNIISFFGFLGMAFLMLMAGIETDLTKIRKFKYKVFIMVLLNGLIPFFAGLLITRYFNYSWPTSLIVGIVFISSSVAIIVPSLKSTHLFNKKIGQLILSAVLIADIISLVALGIFFQGVDPITKFPIPIYLFLLLFSGIFLFRIVPKISRYVLKKQFKKDEEHESKLRYIVVIIIGILAWFSYLGVHPILAAFLAGLLLSHSIHSDKTGKLYAKIHTLGYGLFVPVFFFITGMQIDLTLFRHFDISNILMISLISGLILSKFISGFLAGRLVKLTNKESLVFGSISITQLTTTLAVVYSATVLGILDNVLSTSIILLAAITTIIGPILTEWIASFKN